MNFKNFRIIFILLVFSNVIFAAEFPKLVIMTEDYSPFNFKKDGKVQGIAVDLMVEMLKKVGSNQTLNDIKLLPWARGYQNVQSTPNAVLFSTTRTKEREEMFKWVCPINTITTEMVALKSRGIKISSESDLLKYKIGSVRDDVGEQLTIAAGIPKSKIISGKSYEGNIKKLDAQRLDLYASSMSSVTLQAGKLGIDPTKFESVYILDESHLCYAFNTQISDETINTLQKAYDELIADGTVDEIKVKYKQ